MPVAQRMMWRCPPAQDPSSLSLLSAHHLMSQTTGVSRSRTRTGFRTSESLSSSASMSKTVSRKGSMRNPTQATMSASTQSLLDETRRRSLYTLCFVWISTKAVKWLEFCLCSCVCYGDGCASGISRSGYAFMILFVILSLSCNDALLSQKSVKWQGMLTMVKWLSKRRLVVVDG